MTEPPAPRRAKRRPERRDEILDAAIDLFFARGYPSTSLEEIAGVVGIAGPSIYRHFGSKLEILDAAVKRGGMYVLREHDQVIVEGGLPEEVLTRLVRGVVVAVLRRPKLTAMAWRERHHLAPESRAWFERSYRLQTEEWVHLLLQLRPDLADDEARLNARVVLSMIHNCVQHLPSTPTEATADLLTHIALAALLVPKVPDH